MMTTTTTGATITAASTPPASASAPPAGGGPSTTAGSSSSPSVPPRVSAVLRGAGAGCSEGLGSPTRAPSFPPAARRGQWLQCRVLQHQDYPGRRPPHLLVRAQASHLRAQGLRRRRVGRLRRWDERRDFRVRLRGGAVGAAVGRRGRRWILLGGLKSEYVNDQIDAGARSRFVRSEVSERGYTKKILG